MCLWSITVSCFLLSVCCAWIVFITSLGVSTDRFAQWVEDVLVWTILPSALIVMGFQFLSASMATRLFITSLGDGTSFPSEVKWAVTGIFSATMFVGGNCFWVSIARRTFGFKWRELMAFQGGAMGMRLPRKDLLLQQLQQQQEEEVARQQQPPQPPLLGARSTVDSGGGGGGYYSPTYLSSAAAGQQAPHAGA
jgi:hypothetical protein